ncbi:MAG TPA: hypothetical protein ENJ51_08080 [Leucothrix mucor]|uniref:Uncharacterized protein n=1 Tax=Leucothrix mucor TaxID=45248 RepID=A0A7V2T081_LEUMU|nr:hypothetical protein [Leucothrix mucor]
MKKFKNSLVLTLLISLFSIAILLVSPLINAQQLNQVRAYLAPMDHQISYFPSEQQVQEALAPHKFKGESKSSFPPLEQEPQVFVNQFSTPDVQKVAPQFVAPDLMMNNEAISQRYKQPSGNRYSQQKMKFPPMPSPAKKTNNNFPPVGFENSSVEQFLPNNFGASNKGNLFAFPDAFPVIPFANSDGLNSATDWKKCNGMRNGFLLRPKKKANRKKGLGGRHNSRPDFYPNVIDKVWNESLSAPRSLERMPEGWRSSY